MGENAKKSMNDRDREIYLNGLHRYQDMGVSIYIDGLECPAEDWNKIFEVREDGFFYMGDYVAEPQSGKLTEIRFDRVYYQ